MDSLRHRLEDLLVKLQDPYQRAAYMQERSPLVGLPRPAMVLERPNAVPLERIEFLPPQPGLSVDEEPATSRRLFKHHWLLRVLNLPEKDHCHDDNPK
ncbi:hypothetical protein D9M71_759260 [compost metagenome]